MFAHLAKSLHRIVSPAALHARQASAYEGGRLYEIDKALDI